MADSARLVLVDPDRELEAALRIALNPWRTAILTENLAEPGNTMPGSADRARALAARREAEAVVWISRSTDGFALWMYDARQDRVVARRLSSGPPFDETTAASVALMVKTLLRHSEVPPVAERVQTSPEEPWLLVGVLGGIRFSTSSDAGAEPRLGLRLSAWPRALDGKAAIGLEATSGPGFSVDEPQFSGRWTETAFLLTLHGRLPLAERLGLGVVLGAGGEVTTIDGVLVESAQRTRATRINAIASGHAEVGFQLAPVLRLGLRAGLVHSFRTQTYRVQGEPVLDVSTPAIDTAFVADFSLL
jgi:hypothetical protein